MTFMIGLMNFAVPLQLGVREVAFPTFNSVSFWLTASAVLLINMSLFVGEFAKTGWLVYPPLSELKSFPGGGVDHYLWAIQISGIGTLLTGINFVTPILKVRAPGMTLSRMPIFCWTALVASLLIVAAFPILTATLGMLLLDRYLGCHFFTTDLGGNAMIYVNLIWAWGHSEVYILILPAFGVFSEVISTFSGKPLFGYRSMVMATKAICIPSSWCGCSISSRWEREPTSMRSRRHDDDHRRADRSENIQLAFHDVGRAGAIPGTDALGPRPYGNLRHRGNDGRVAGCPASRRRAAQVALPCGAFSQRRRWRRSVRRLRRIYYWFPKAFGFKLDERLGKAAFWFWSVGFYVAFMPLYVLGFEGMTRRMQLTRSRNGTLWLLVAACGAALILAGTGFQVAQLVVSIRNRRRCETGRRSLEWPHSRMGYQFAAAGIQLRRHAECHRGRGLLGDQVRFFTRSKQKLTQLSSARSPYTVLACRAYPALNELNHVYYKQFPSDFGPFPAHYET
jgi:cytochrome o ubiquinol oxidase subunit 1